MSIATTQVLNNQEVEHFIEHGWVMVRECIDRAFCREVTRNALERLGADENRPETWPGPKAITEPTREERVKDVSPKAWGAICQLVGGEDKIVNTRYCRYWRDKYRINFSAGADQPWQPPSAERGGWHKDGQFFRHFLDSPEQGLLAIVFWWDVEPQSGGTFIAPDSVGVVARYLAEHPEGIGPGKFGKLIHECNEFMEATGRAGDVALLHPYMLHTPSQNPSGRPRIISNPCYSLTEPMNLNRDDPSEYTPVERGILRGLGVDRYEFTPTRPRRRNEDLSPLKDD